MRMTWIDAAAMARSERSPELRKSWAVLRVGRPNLVAAASSGEIDGPAEGVD